MSTKGPHGLFDMDIEIKALDSEGRFAGYGSVFGVVDSQRDIILRGAFEKTLSERRDKIKLLWQHNFSEPVGVITHIFEDRHGLYVEARLLLSLNRGREAYELLKAGAIKGLSIGYTPLQYDFDPVTGVRRITELELWEISLVTFPANSAAQVTLVKQGEEARYAGIEQRMPDEYRMSSAAQTINPHEHKRWEQARRTGELIRLCDAIARARGMLRS